MCVGCIEVICDDDDETGTVQATALQTIQMQAATLSRAHGGVNVSMEYGDSIMAYCGFARTDDPVHLFEFLVQLVKGVRKLADVELLQLAVRVGVHVGSVIVGGWGTRQHPRLTTWGEGCDVAKLCARYAEPGGIVATERFLEMVPEPAKEAMHAAAAHSRVIGTISQKPLVQERGEEIDEGPPQHQSAHWIEPDFTVLAMPEDAEVDSFEVSLFAICPDSVKLLHPRAVSWGVFNPAVQPTADTPASNGGAGSVRHSILGSRSGCEEDKQAVRAEREAYSKLIKGLADIENEDRAVKDLAVIVKKAEDGFQVTSQQLAILEREVASLQEENDAAPEEEPDLVPCLDPEQETRLLRERMDQLEQELLGLQDEVPQGPGDRELHREWADLWDHLPDLEMEVAQLEIQHQTMQDMLQSARDTAESLGLELLHNTLSESHDRVTGGRAPGMHRLITPDGASTYTPTSTMLEPYSVYADSSWVSDWPGGTQSSDLHRSW
eukprot:CAMPEP_0204374250 /NCGR_PEP_ID=MMETSP0469-20131031/48537_1 /ASSEMBLY_ACC=CAM_ASM_000384 /TAXON_ID=2969 /ORGANISM="Oxyrrhis marina" /LENGTH=494 /DNA_ID=CAMNT_0051364811 /DNA_START=27 /DNA_END=1508 /DNA_ORIENTATION=-